MTALTLLVTPGPAVTTASPGARVSRAVASAAKTAVCSCRTSTSRSGGSALTAASYSGNTWPPERVNMAVTPYRRATATACVPPCPDISVTRLTLPPVNAWLPGQSEADAPTPAGSGAGASTGSAVYWCGSVSSAPPGTLTAFMISVSTTDAAMLMTTAVTPM